jgi:hypothetical protein
MTPLDPSIVEATELQSPQQAQREGKAHDALCYLRIMSGPHIPRSLYKRLHGWELSCFQPQQHVSLRILVRVRHELVMKMFASGLCGTERPFDASLRKVGPHPSSFRDDIPEVETGCMSNHAGCRPSLSRKAKMAARVRWLMRRFSLRLSSVDAEPMPAGRESYVQFACKAPRLELLSCQVLFLCRVDISHFTIRLSDFQSGACASPSRFDESHFIERPSAA